MNWGFNGNNADYIINEAGTYDIVFTFNPSAVLANGFNVTCDATKVGTVGISQIEAEALKGNVYNLNGQKVTNVKKGLYIVNGKKTIKK